MIMIKKWIIFGLYGALLNVISFIIQLFVFMGGYPCNPLLPFMTLFLPGLVLWILGGTISKKEFKFSTIWMAIFSLLILLFWGASIVTVIYILVMTPKSCT